MLKKIRILIVALLLMVRADEGPFMVFTIPPEPPVIFLGTFHEELRTLKHRAEPPVIFLGTFHEELRTLKHQEEEVYYSPPITYGCIIGTSKMSYMPYTAVTAVNSPQYALISQSYILNGYLYIDGFMLVALGSYWGDLGTKYMLYYDDGRVLPVIKADHKADEHTWDGCQQRWDGSVMEIIVDYDTNNSIGLYHGDFQYDSYLGGNITYAEKVE